METAFVTADVAGRQWTSAMPFDPQDAGVAGGRLDNIMALEHRVWPLLAAGAGRERRILAGLGWRNAH